ncbi:MAG: hypothetical protein QM765_43190 [Myxococcales bacterium]
MTMISPPPAPPAAQHTLVPLGHESLVAIIGPGMAKVAVRAVNEFRRRPGWTREQTIHPRDLLGFEDVGEFLEAFSYLCYAQGATPDQARDEANWLGQHLCYYLNFELHHRKTFWVDEPLAWMLGQTRLDIEGRALKLPFPSFAVAFTDRATCARAEHLMARDRERRQPGPVQSLTAYLTRLPEEGEGLGLNVSLLADQRDGHWPYFVSRDLFVRPDDDLDTLLDSHFPEVQAESLDPFFRSDELKRLVHLVVNAVLYATSYSDTWPVLASPVKELRKSANGKGEKRRQRVEQKVLELAKTNSAEDVFHLPGNIPISQLQALREMERSDSGRQLLARFMVRGHWRRAAESWTDQRLRWIEPYWKGPEMATVIEREYQLKP